MKCTKWMATTMATLLLLGVSGAAAQSLGDYARAARKNKPEPTSASRHYDNDNLPTGEPLSVVGPPPTPATSDASADTTKAAAAVAAPSAADKQKAADDSKKKLDQQKQKVDSLARELDLDQRELRLRAAAAITDPSISVRDVKWDKEDARYKSEIEEKQKALDAARQELNEIQDLAHKAGMDANEKDSDKDKNSDSDNNKK